MLGPGWVPAGLVYALAVVGLTSTGVSLVDVLAFSAYAALCLVLPGTLLWRLVAGDRPRPFVSDVVFGTCLAYAVELFWYLGVRAAGAPILVLAWPVLVVGVSLLPRWRSRLWRPADVHRMQAGWSWALAAMVGFGCAFMARNIWSLIPLSRDGLRSGNQDLAYHLSLVAELRHHVPAASPVVDGEPLYYHWFLHAEMAASSWATGIEPVVLLQRLSLAPMIVLTLMGTALLAARLTSSATLGLLAPALLLAGGLASMVSGSWGEQYDLWLNGRMYISPTITFSQLVLIPVLAVGLRLLRADLPVPRRLWATAAVLLAALSASKATVLPFVIAGFLGVVLIGALFRRLERRALALFALSAVAFLVARVLVYGSESRGVRWDPLVLYETQAVEAGLVEGSQQAGLGLAILMLATFLVQQLSFAAGMVGLVGRELWRDPRAQFLVGAVAAGVVASFTLSANASAQQHFIRSTPVLLAVGSVWGLSALLPREQPRRLVPVLAATALLAAGAATVVQALTERGLIGLEAQRSPWGLVQPHLLAATAVLTLVAVAVVVARLRPQWRGLTVAVAVVACLGLGVPSIGGLVVDAVRDPVPAQPTDFSTQAPMIGTGGIEAARWLRDNSDPDDLVATNRHCREFSSAGRCDNRMFWLAAYSERGILVEGWSYQVRTAARVLSIGIRSCCLPFWDPALLRTNNTAFLGDPGAVETLRDTYGVRWMVLDRRSPYRIDPLLELAEVRYRGGVYVVLELPPDTEGEPARR